MPSMKRILACSCLAATLIASVARFAQAEAPPPVGAPTEAPAGFNTPSFNGAHSISNGLVEPPGDTFARDQQVYEQNKSVADGLGPVYNATSCVMCHQNPNSGSAGLVTFCCMTSAREMGLFRLGLKRPPTS